MPNELELIALKTEFDLYLTFVKRLVLDLPTCDDRIRAALWLQKLRSITKEEQLKLRNEHLKLFLFALHRRSLLGVFEKKPPKDELETFHDGLTLLEMTRELIELTERKKTEMKKEGDEGFGACPLPPVRTNISYDLREYAACQEIPKFGAHVFYAVSSEPIQMWHKVDGQQYPDMQAIPNQLQWELSMAKISDHVLERQAALDAALDAQKEAETGFVFDVKEDEEEDKTPEMDIRTCAPTGPGGNASAFRWKSDSQLLIYQTLDFSDVGDPHNLIEQGKHQLEMDENALNILDESLPGRQRVHIRVPYYQGLPPDFIERRHHGIYEDIPKDECEGPPCYEEEAEEIEEEEEEDDFPCGDDTGDDLGDDGCADMNQCTCELPPSDGDFPCSTNRNVPSQQQSGSVCGGNGGSQQQSGSVCNGNAGVQQPSGAMQQTGSVCNANAGMQQRSGCQSGVNSTMQQQQQPVCQSGGNSMQQRPSQTGRNGTQQRSATASCNCAMQQRQSGVQNGGSVVQQRSGAQNGGNSALQQQPVCQSGGNSVQQQRSGAQSVGNAAMQQQSVCQGGGKSAAQQRSGAQNGGNCTQQQQQSQSGGNSAAQQRSGSTSSCNCAMQQQQSGGQNGGSVGQQQRSGGQNGGNSAQQSVCQSGGNSVQQQRSGAQSGGNTALQQRASCQSGCNSAVQQRSSTQNGCTSALQQRASNQSGRCSAMQQRSGTCSNSAMQPDPPRPTSCIPPPAPKCTGLLPKPSNGQQNRCSQGNTAQPTSCIPPPAPKCTGLLPKPSNSPQNRCSQGNTAQNTSGSNTRPSQNQIESPSNKSKSACKCSANKLLEQQSFNNAC